MNKIYKVQNKYYEFFLTQIDQNYSIYYTFIPLTILIIFGEKDKKFQKIILSLKESITLIKNEKNCGMVNTLFKCMFLDRKNNRIFFKLELFEDYKNEIVIILKKFKLLIQVLEKKERIKCKQDTKIKFMKYPF